MSMWDAERHQMEATLVAVDDDLQVLGSRRTDAPTPAPPLPDPTPGAAAALTACRDHLERSATAHDRTADAYEDAAKGCRADTMAQIAYLYGAQVHRRSAQNDRDLSTHLQQGEFPDHLDLETKARLRPRSTR